MEITIHQPEHMIWIGLLDKIKKSDVFVILDNVQFKKNDFQNRNKIRTGWITVPVKKHKLNTDIKDIEIADVRWKKFYLNKIKECYSESKYFNKYFPMIEKIIMKDYKKLMCLNLDLMRFIFREFKIEKKIIYASNLGIKVKGGHNVVLAICRKLKAKTYLSGAGGKNYLNLSEFKKEGIEVIFQEGQFKHLSSIDLLFNQREK